MDVILLEKVQNLGKLGDRVSVRNGYARNYLLPKRKAVIATADNLAEFERRRIALEKSEGEALSAARSRRETLNGRVIVVAAKAGEEGKLFGSVGTHDIAEVAERMGLILARQELRLPEGPFRQVGNYDIIVHLHPDVDASITISVVAENEGGTAE